MSLRTSHKAVANHVIGTNPPDPSPRDRASVFLKKSVALTIGTFSATEFSAQWALNSVPLNSVPTEH